MEIGRPVPDATTTVAAGVNFPARTVVLFNSDRFNGTEFLPLTATEFHQMTGRAGRRGMDRIGFAVTVPGKYMDIRHTAALLDAPPSDVLSQIRINFSMVLNLLLSHTPAQVENLLDRSFATYLLMRSKRKQRGLRHDPKYLWRDFARHLNFLREHRYVESDGALTDDGRWASQLRVDQPLLIAEAFRRKAFPENDPGLMAAVVSCFVFDRDSDDRMAIDDLPPQLMAAFLTLKAELTPFARRMLADGFNARPLFFSPAAAIHAWAGGSSWERTLSIAGMEEGIFASLVFRTADNLRHIRALAPVFPTAADSAATAIELILRDPVSLYY